MTQRVVFHNAIKLGSVQQIIAIRTDRKNLSLESQIFLEQIVQQNVLYIPTSFWEWVVISLDPCTWCIIKYFGFHAINWWVQRGASSKTSGYKWWVSVWSKRHGEIMCKRCQWFVFECFTIPTRKMIWKTIIWYILSLTIGNFDVCCNQSKLKNKAWHRMKMYYMHHAYDWWAILQILSKRNPSLLISEIIISEFI